MFTATKLNRYFGDRESDLQAEFGRKSDFPPRSAAQLPQAISPAKKWNLSGFFSEVHASFPSSAWGRPVRKLRFRVSRHRVSATGKQCFERANFESQLEYRK